MSEPKCMTDRRLFSRKGWTVECEIAFDQIENSKIERPYREALTNFLTWLAGDRLNALVAADEEEKSAGGRKSRLHRQPECWRFSLTARPSGKYLSVSLSVTGRGERIERSYTECRVWEGEKGILCPLSCFLPAYKARKYDKWAYSLENDELIVYRKGKVHKMKNCCCKNIAKT